MGSVPALKDQKMIGFPSNTGPDPMKSQSCKVIIQWWAIIGPPAKRHFNGVSLAGRLLPAFGDLWSLAP